MQLQWWSKMYHRDGWSSSTEVWERERERKKSSSVNRSKRKKEERENDISRGNGYIARQIHWWEVDE